jgi:hypothetical protein
MRIRNWERFQQYKDREPKWIKIYRELLDDVDWFDLDGDTAKLLVNLWLLAAATGMDGSLPSVRTIAFRLRMTEKQVRTGISKLSQWIVEDDTDLYRPVQERTPEKETDTETELEEEKDTPLPPKGEKRSHPMPPDWRPSLETRAYGEALGLRPIDITDMAEDMRLWALSAGGKNTLKKNWDLAFKGWMRRARGKLNGHGPPRNGTYKHSTLMQAGKDLIDEFRERDEAAIIDFKPHLRIAQGD